MQIQEFKATLTRVRRISPTTLEFRFRREDGLPVDYQPGQFFRFDMTDGRGRFERSYSLANIEGDPGISGDLDLVVSRVEGGRGTELLFGAEPGMQLEVKGPFGRLVLPEALPDRLVMVGTSVGLAPYLPMLRHLDQIGRADSSVVLVLGVREPEEFLYRQWLLDLRSRCAWFDLRICYSRQLPQEPADYERSGYVTAELRALVPDPERDLVMLCGNPRMIDDCYGSLREAGFGVRRVLREKYLYGRETSAGDKPSVSEEQKRLIAEKLEQLARRKKGDA